MDFNIKTSSYDIQEKWINELAPKFFNTKDLNLLQAGLFGYINEMASNSLEDSLLTSSIYYNELIPIKAKLSQSIYSYSSLLELDNLNATPAKLPIILAIRVSDILEKAVYPKGISSYREFFIDRNSYILVGGKSFTFDYNLKIIVKEANTKGEIVLTPIYDFDNLNEISNLKSKYIKSITVKDNKEDYLFLNLEVRQLMFNRQEFSVVSRDVIDRLSYEVNFTNYLAYFNVLYKRTPTSQPVLLDKYFVDNFDPKSEKFCFYEYEKNKLRVFFSPYLNYFRPEVGGKIIIEYYTTYGKEGNLTYKGENIILNFNIDNTDLRHDYKGVMTEVKIVGDSSNGENPMPLEEIKKEVIKTFSSRKSLINENDLNIFFNNYRKNSNIIFIKKRDDVITRLFSSFILFKDKDKNVIPTNTVNLLLNESECIQDNDDSIFIFPAGKTFKNNEIDIYESLNLSKEQIINLEKDKDTFLLSNPFLTQVCTRPISVKYYLNSIFDTYDLNHNYLNLNTLHEFLINKVKINRDAITKKENKYNISFTLNTTLDLEEIIKDMDFNNDKTNPVIIKGIIKHKNTEIAYFDCLPNEIILDKKQINFKADLVTTDFINLESAIEITNLKPITEERDLFYSFFLPSSDLKIEFLIFYNGYEDKTKQKLSNFSYLKDYCLIGSYETEKSVEIIKDYSNIMKSYVRFNKNESQTNFDLFIKSVPLIRASYLLNNKNTKDVYDNIVFYSRLLEEILEKIENNFDIDLKFFNTYGKSNYFLIENGEKLNRTNISLNFKIKPSIIINNDIIYDIRIFIRNYIEQFDETNSIYISNMIRALEQNFQFIQYIEFKGINEYSSDLQAIEQQKVDFKKMSKEELINYVPEYLSINTIMDSKDKYLPEINISII